MATYHTTIKLDFSVSDKFVEDSTPAEVEDTMKQALHTLLHQKSFSNVDIELTKKEPIDLSLDQMRSLREGLENINEQIRYLRDSNAGNARKKQDKLQEDLDDIIKGLK